MASFILPQLWRRKIPLSMIVLCFLIQAALYKNIYQDMVVMQDLIGFPKTSQLRNRSLENFKVYLETMSYEIQT